MSESSSDPFRTRPSIFLRLKSAEAAPREMAWTEFRDRYAPVIAGFARKLGVRGQDVDDVIQDVFLGFFSVAPKFEYDPSKGRFRGYLKTVTVRSLRSRGRQALKVNAVPLEQLQDDAATLEESWEQSWREQILRRAIQSVRESYAAHPRTFKAWELNAVQKLPAAEVSEKLGMPVNSVYKAKQRISEALREKVRELEAEDE